MSLELILHAPESQAMHFRFFCTLRLFCHTCISWSEPLLKCTSAELWISELMILICDSLLLTICKMPYIFMKISASGLHLADCALIHAAWFGHNPSFCLEAVATPNASPSPSILFWVYWIITELKLNIKSSMSLSVKCEWVLNALVALNILLLQLCFPSTNTQQLNNCLQTHISVKTARPHSQHFEYSYLVSGPTLLIMTL